jgi:hypothetical protein
LQKGRYDVAQMLIGNDTLSSALVPSGMVLRLYEHANFQGAFIDIREDTLAVSLDWNDRVSSIVVTPENEDFPENEIEVLREYVSDDLNQLITGMRGGLSAVDITVTGGITGPNAALDGQIYRGRKQLLQFLNHPSHDRAFNALREIGKLFSKRNFGDAMRQLQELSAAIDHGPPVCSMSSSITPSIPPT